MRAKPAPKVQAAPLDPRGCQHTPDGKVVQPPAAMPRSVVAEAREAGMALASAGGGMITKQQMEAAIDKRVQEVITEKVQTTMATQNRQIQLEAERLVSSGLQAINKRQDEQDGQLTKLAAEVGEMKTTIDALAQSQTSRTSFWKK